MNDPRIEYLNARLAHRKAKEKLTTTTNTVKKTLESLLALRPNVYSDQKIVDEQNWPTAKSILDAVKQERGTYESAKSLWEKLSPDNKVGLQPFSDTDAL